MVGDGFFTCQVREEAEIGDGRRELERRRGTVNEKEGEEGRGLRYKKR